MTIKKKKLKKNGPVRGLNPGPPAPEAGVVPLDQQTARLVVD